MNAVCVTFVTVCVREGATRYSSMISLSNRMNPFFFRFSSIAAENLVEYQWPPDASGDYYMLQEQVSTFLNITSFKRKYPSETLQLVGSR